MARIVPWLSWLDWKTCQKLLFSDNSSDVAAGLDRVSAWKVRGSHVPAAVEITADLISLNVRLNSSSNSTSVAHAQSLRLGLSMAIVRLVNGVADQSQRGKFAHSVADLANDIGLPRMLVDIRHEAAHNELPSLAILLTAGNQALAWLREHYWEAQNKALHDRQVALRHALNSVLMQQTGEAASCASEQHPLIDASICMATEETESGHGSEDKPKVSKKRRRTAAKAMRQQAEAAMQDRLNLIGQSVTEASDILTQEVLSPIRAMDLEKILPNLQVLCDCVPHMRQLLVSAIIGQLAEGSRVSRVASSWSGHRFQQQKEPDSAGEFKGVNYALVEVLRALIQTRRSSFASPSKDASPTAPQSHNLLSQQFILASLSRCLTRASQGGPMAEVAHMLASCLDDVAFRMPILRLLQLSSRAGATIESGSVRYGHKGQKTEAKVIASVESVSGRWRKATSMAEVCPREEEDKVISVSKALDEAKDLHHGLMLSLQKFQQDGFNGQDREVNQVDGVPLWGLAPSWTPCPIGMLPTDHPLGQLPLLDPLGCSDLATVDTPEAMAKSEGEVGGEVNAVLSSEVQKVGMEVVHMEDGEVMDGGVVLDFSCFSTGRYLLRGYEVVPLSEKELISIQSNICMI